MTSETHVTWHDPTVSRRQREQLHGHRGCVVWFTGLSGSGKSTVANLLDRKLFESLPQLPARWRQRADGFERQRGHAEKRHGEEFAKRFGLGFGAQDREENIRRIGAVSRLFAEAGLITLTAFVSPYRRDRDAVRAALEPGDFIEVFVDVPLEVCEARDPKGLYKKARAEKSGALPALTIPTSRPSERN